MSDMHLKALGLTHWQQRQKQPAPQTKLACEKAPSAIQPKPTTTLPVEELDWKGLKNWLAQQDTRGASQAVFGIGSIDADVVIIGEAPGAREDAQGEPFVGPSGQLLDKMLKSIGLSRKTNVFITNICKFRPPNNRDPNPDEIAADWPVLNRQIELIEPKILISIGKISAQTLLGRQDSLGKLRGQVHHQPQFNLPCIVTYHPAYLLRSPQAKSKSWADLKLIAQQLTTREFQS